MFNFLRKISILVIEFIIIVGIGSYTMGFDLADQITSKFQSVFNKGFSNDYLSNAYSSKLSKDPFGDAMSNIEDRSMQLKIAGAQYVEELLHKKGCNLSKKKIWGILYYFVPEFRVELARSLKQSLGDYDSKKYVLDDEMVKKYCEEYFVCQKSEGYSSLKIWREEGIKENDLRGLASATPMDVMTNCKEFFQINYKAGQDNKEMLQNVEVSQAGVDRFWNNTTDDSPYDIMVDVGILAKLLYQEAQEPVKPVFYKLPVFSNSLKSAGKNNESDSQSTSLDEKSSDVGNLSGYGNEQDTEETNSLLWGDEDLSTQDPNGDSDGEVDKIVKVQPLFDGVVIVQPLSHKDDGRGGYDNLVEGLNSYRIDDTVSKLYSNICGDEDEGTEVEPEIESEDTIYMDGIGEIFDDFSELSDEEYQEIIDSILESVDKYDTLPDDIEAKINQQSEGISDSVSNSETASELEETAKQIKNCYKSCEGLRIDQKASCMLRCSCGEIESPIFDPEKTPGLGPIFLIRFCGVPAVNTKFSVGGKRIHSIEEGLYEIYGVVDKLSREGKLGKWTQQYEFLDSSAKQVNMANSFAFSIDVELVDITNKRATHSDQFVQKKLKDFNEQAQVVYGISNPLSDPSTKNAYRIGGDGGSEVTYLGVTDVSLNVRLEPMVDLIEDSDANRYVTNVESFSIWMDQQGSFWEAITKNISNLTEYSRSLNIKKCDK